MKTACSFPRRFTLGLVYSAATMLAAVSADRQNDPSTYSWYPELSPGGPVLVTVSLKTQTAAVYRNGIKIGSCLVSTGKPGHETPTGVFHILNKDADHHSSTYNNASMPYSERLTWGGVALHAGGLPGYPSSHGCIHLPYQFSKDLFEVTHNGTTVVISGDGPDLPVSHGHHIGFAGGAESSFVWQPEKSPAGPVSLLFSRADSRLFIIRDGITIGECPTESRMFAKRPAGTSAFVFRGWKQGADGPETDWVQAGGTPVSHETKLSDWFKIDPRFKHVVEAVLMPGANLVVTDQSVTGTTRSGAGFSILQGQREEAAE